MSRRRRSPQDKEVASYQKDGRNGDGENDKGSRRAIPRRKAWVNRTHRAAVRRQLAGADVEEATDAADEVPRDRWAKAPDRRLGDDVEARARRRADTGQAPSPSTSPLRDEARRRRGR